MRKDGRMRMKNTNSIHHLFMNEINEFFMKNGDRRGIWRSQYRTLSIGKRAAFFSGHLSLVPCVGDRWLEIGLGPIHSLEREEFKVILLVKPGAFEIFERQVASAAQRERVDGKLNVSVLFFFRLRLVVKNVDVPVSDLQKVNVTGDHVAIKVERESAVAIVSNVIAAEIDGDFYGDGDGIVHEHEVLERLVTLLIAG